MNKICTKCKKEKPIEEFSKQQRGLYGRKAYCRQCSSQLWKEHYWKNHDKIIEKSRIYSKENIDRKRDYWNKWYLKNRDAVIKSRRTLENNARHRASENVRLHVKNGDIKKSPCEVCGDINSNAHHYLGYDKEHYLDIKWLCTKHHNGVHRKYD